MVVGEASILITPDMLGFDAALEAESQGAFGSFKKDAETAGEDAGAGLRTGVRDEAGRLEGDLGEAGLASGVALRDGMKDGTAGLADDLGDAGALGGANLRKGVKDHADGLEDDLGKAGEDSGSAYSRALDAELEARLGELDGEGEKAGGRLSKGIGKGLEKLGDVVANTGLPIGGLGSKLDEAGKSMQDAEGHSSGLGESLDHLGGYALLGVAGAAAVVGAVGVHLAEGMQTADTSIANAEGTSASFAKHVGDDMLSTAGKSEFTGEAMTKAFAEVAGQLKSTEGHALSAGESLHVMTAAGSLAEAKQMELGAATSTVSGLLQAFSLHTGESAHVADVLYSASNATGLGVEGLGTQLTKVRSKLGETSGSIGQLAGLLVDMTDHGITGRAAMTGLNTGLNTLLKTSDGVATAVNQQNTAYGAMTPPLKALAKQYESGAISSKEFKKQTEELAPGQANLVTAFTKASTAVQTAQLKYKEMGLTVFDAQGKFVGMGSIIDQLGPRFDKMSQQQQLAAAATLFGAGAARQMVAIIKAGPEAYEKATAAVEKHGAAEAAAKKQSETLHGEEKVLGAEIVDVGTKIGEVLIPIVTAMVHEFVIATTFVLQHKEILIALGVVITGVLGTAIAVFTVNKMAAFGQSFIKAGQTIGLFSKEAVADVGEVEGALVAQDEAAATAAGDMRVASGQMVLDFESVGTAAGETAGEVEGSATAMEGSFEGAAVAAETASGGIIASLAAILPEIAVVAAAILALKVGWEAFEGETLSESKAMDEKAHNYKGPQKGHGYSESQAAYLEKEGLSKNAAAGVVAGFGAEGGTPTAEDPKEGAYGLGQWTAERKAALAAFAKSKGEEISSEKAQLEFTAKEIKERGELGKLNSAGSPKEAADLFIKNFERPQNDAEVEGRVKASGSSLGGSKHAAATSHNTAALERLTHVISTPSSPTAGVGHPSAGKTLSPEKEQEKATKAQEKAAHEHEKEVAKQAKEEEKAKKAALAAEVKGQEKALGDWVSKTLAEETKAGAVRRAGIAQEITEHKQFIASMIADEKKGATEKQATQKAQAAQEAREQEAGEKERTKLTEAITSKSLSTLNSALTKAHEGALKVLEDKLNATHKAALEKLDAELVKTWKEAEARKAKLEYEESDAGKAAAWERSNIAARELEKAEAETPEGKRLAEEKASETAAAEQLKAQEESEKAQVAAITKQSQVASDAAALAVTEIGDSTKVALDKQAEVGLSGTAEISAHLQTVYDELTGNMDKAIGEAKIAQDEAAGKGAVAEAEAAARTSRVESEAKVKEAEAQRQLELAKATASTASSGGAGVNIESLVISAAGMSSADILNELAWSLKTGALPVAAPTAVPVPVAA